MSKIKIREVSAITIPNSGYTHAGIFHADELFCTALFRILNPEFKVTRGFKPKESAADIVYDIGGGEFDHHGEPEFRDDGTGIPYASFGKIWRKYGCFLLSEAGQKRFDRQFVERLDAHDNGGARNQLSEVISSLNPNWDDPTETSDTQFQIALNFVQGILERQITSAQAFEKAEGIANEVKVQDTVVGIINHFAPIIGYLAGNQSNKKFLVYPAIRGGWNAQVIPIAPGSRDPKCPFPKEWWGRPEDCLPDDITFCHNTGFMIASSTKEGAIHACAVALEKEAERIWNTRFPQADRSH